MTATLQPATPADDHRFHLLDALRGVAALLIVCYHAPPFVYAGNRDSLYFAVDFFFCLSGFALAFSYEKRLQTFLTLKDFLAARVIRLYPMFLLGILLGIAEAWLLFASTRPTGVHGLRFGLLILLQLLMLPNLGVWPVNIAFPLDFPAWSLLYEMLASVGFGWLVRRWRVSRRLMFSIFFSLALLWIYRAIHGGGLGVGGTSAPKGVVQAIVRTALSFALGVAALHVFRRTPRPQQRKLAHEFAAIGICCSLVLILLAPLEILRTTAFHLAAIFLISPALVWGGALVRLTASWSRCCAFLGNISYPLYLLHGPILVPLMLVPRFERIAKEHPGAARLLLPMVLIVGASMAHLAFKYYETPLRKRLTQLYNSRRLATPLQPHALSNNTGPHSNDHVYTEA